MKFWRHLSKIARKEYQLKMKKRKYKGLNVTLIHQLKKKIEELKESEEKFRTIFNSVNDGILLADTKTKKFYIGNKKICQMLVYEAEELKRVRVLDIHLKKDLPYVLKQFKMLSMKKIEMAKDIPVLRKDRSIFYADINSSLITLNEKAYLIGIFRDITERKKVEETLRESEEKYKTLLENIPQKIFFKDRDSVYISCNGNYAGDLKIKPEQIKGKTDYDFYPKKLAEKYRTDDKRVMISGKTEDIEEEYIQNREKRFVHTVKTPVKDEKGNVIGILGIFWDITEKKKAEEILKGKCEKEVGELKNRLKGKR